MTCQPLRSILWLALLCSPGLPPSGTYALAGDSQEELRFFEEKVRPILATKCLRCHGESKQQGGLRLDSRAAMLAGGESGAAIQPGDPATSTLIQAINYSSYEMPPEGRLPEEEIAALTAWVARGAPWPEGRPKGTVRDKEGGITDADRRYWAFQPIQRVPVPRVDDGGWSRGDVDRFIFQRLAEAGFRPSGPADRATLIRRVCFDLTGLPPTPDEIDEFVRDDSPQAYDRLVDRLLDSNHFGEKWARHWLDLVRYAESDGFKQDAYRPHAWRYRDYVIRSFNQDKSYVEFIREQLAGDELPEVTLDGLAATSFLRHWIYEYNQRDARTQWSNILNDVTDVTAEVFLGLSVGCARCHDHKFDPILRKDYYRLQSFFAPLLPRDDIPFLAGTERQQYEARLAAWEDQTRALREELARIEQPHRERAAEAAINKFPPDIRPMIRKPAAMRSPFEHQLAELAGRQIDEELAKLDLGTKLAGDEKLRWQDLKQQLADAGKRRPPPAPAAFTVTDVGPVGPLATIPGDRSQRPIAPGFLSVLDPGDAVIEPPVGAMSTGRRTALADWIASADNPLTARVLVNRVWQYHFGQGIVGTSSDFGHLGDAPTHPELLDWLAGWFIDSGWSLKKLHRLLVTSATYRQASAAASVPDGAAGNSAGPQGVDPDNRWLWHMPVRRLDADQIRDAALAVSGELDKSAGGPGVDAAQPRRTIYTKVLRNVRDPLLDVFDAPDHFNSTSVRNVTTTPTQALLMINGPWMLRRAEAFAARIERESGGDRRRLVARAFQLAYGRLPTAEELAGAETFFQNNAGTSSRPLSAEGPAAFAPFPGRGMALDVVADAGLSPLVSAPDSPSFPDADMTIEAIVLLRSVYDDAAVRTIVSHWDGDSQHPGWSLGVTSRQSRFSPRNLILQLVGSARDGSIAYEVVPSNLQLEFQRPYYVAARVRISDPSANGVTFFVRDLSRPGLPMQSASAPHQVVRGYRSHQPLVIGGRAGNVRHRWDGLIDDVRLSTEALPAEALRDRPLDTARDADVGFWRFEPDEGLLHDSTPRNNHLTQQMASPSTPSTAPEVVDFCHVLLNSNEFLYLD